MKFSKKSSMIVLPYIPFYPISFINLFLPSLLLPSLFSLPLSLLPLHPFSLSFLLPLPIPLSLFPLLCRFPLLYFLYFPLLPYLTPSSLSPLGFLFFFFFFFFLKLFCKGHSSGENMRGRFHFDFSGNYYEEETAPNFEARFEDLLKSIFKI